MAIPLGDIDFPNVNFDMTTLANALQIFVQSGSQRGQVLIDELEIVSRDADNVDPFDTVAEAIKAGTRLFDALAYFSIPKRQRPIVEYMALEAGEVDPTVGEISKAVFFVFMWILIRGSAPSSSSEAIHGPIPNFFTSVMGLNLAPHVYSQTLASFDLQAMNPSWVKNIKLTNIGQEAQNRLALGVAGYRVPAALCYIPWRNNLPANILSSAYAVRRFVKRGMMWDCFSGTRTSAFLDAVKNFNKNVENLILDIATEEHIAYFVEHKILAVVPTRRIQYNQYLSWTHDTFSGFDKYIFGVNDVPMTDEPQHSTMEMHAADQD